MKRLPTLLLSFFCTVCHADLLLTGTVIADRSQVFITPFVSDWKAQLQWMREEGVQVEKNDVIVVFDTANLASEIEQQEAQLDSAREQAKENILNLEQEMIEAEHGLNQAQLEYQLASLDVDIPANFRSDYEIENADFALMEADKKLQQARTDLQIKKEALAAEEKKQGYEIERIESALGKLQLDLDGMRMRADHSGVVLHASHPWYGTKITIGSSVQTGWQVASVVRSTGSRVQAWVNEVDWPRISEGQNTTLVADAYPEITLHGKIIKTSQQAKEKKDWGSASYYEIEIHIDDKPSTLSLFPGMSMQVRVLSNKG